MPVKDRPGSSVVLRERNDQFDTESSLLVDQIEQGNRLWASKEFKRLICEAIALMTFTSCACETVSMRQSQDSIGQNSRAAALTRHRKLKE